MGRLASPSTPSTASEQYDTRTPRLRGVDSLIAAGSLRHDEHWACCAAEHAIDDAAEYGAAEFSFASPSHDDEIDPQALGSAEDFRHWVAERNFAAGAVACDTGGDGALYPAVRHLVGNAQGTWIDRDRAG